MKKRGFFIWESLETSCIKLHFLEKSPENQGFLPFSGDAVKSGCMWKSSMLCVAQSAAIAEKTTKGAGCRGQDINDIHNIKSIQDIKGIPDIASMKGETKWQKQTKN